ncbi:MAG TPA: HD domain-containing protein [Acidimicrobiales bacterium]|nr:HD domain-containing protein [Acidimicrobiales bacterium]
MSARSVAEVIELYDRLGGDPYDEVVTQVAHALQSAARAQDAGAADTLVAAALLHDVGHLLDLDRGPGPTGAGIRDADLHHEDTGAAWLRPLFPPEVTAPIALHVRAKRYLCAVDPAYRDRLSEGSVRSLVLQGGPMAGDEVQRFEALPASSDAVLLRRWDDAAKVVGASTPALAEYRSLLHGLAATAER